jgi:hypothetical protein
MVGPSPHLLPRLSPAPEASPLAARLARRGGRAFLIGDELVLAMPGAGGPQVLVPRGFGRPLLAVSVAGAMRALGTGAPCHPARWVSVGGVAARVREVPLPRGPARALPAQDAPAGDAEGPWLVVRTEALAGSAARLLDPSVGHGAVVVAGPRVRAVSAQAARAGVRLGQSVALARRKCPGVRVVAAPDDAAVEAAVAGVVGGEKVGGAWRVRLPAGGDAGEHAARVLRRLWQRAGVEAAGAVAERVEDAAGLARVLRPGQVGVVPAAAAGAWAGRGGPGRWWAGDRAASWQGAALPDLDGAIARARGLADAVPARDGALRFTVRGEQGEARVDVPLPRGCDRALRDAAIDAGLRGRLAGVGAVVAVRLSVRDSGGAVAAPPAAEVAGPAAPRQLALLPGMR